MPKENSKHLAYAQLRLWKASSAWMGFLLLNPTAAAQGACLGEWHLTNSAHLHKNLFRMMLSLDIQLLAKNLWMTPNLCRIEQTMSVLISKIKVLHTETTDPGVQSVSMQRQPGTHQRKRWLLATAHSWRRRWLLATAHSSAALWPAGPLGTSACWPETLCWGCCLQTSRLIPYWESGEIREAQNP